MRRLFDAIRWRLRAVFHGRDVESELDREVRFHIEMEVESYVRAGVPPAEARRRALLAFGGVERYKESTRDERGVRWLDETLSDLRLAVRSFKKHPGFAATAVLTMAIGIGAATAVFSLANWVLLRPVPGIAAPNELVSIGFYARENSPTGASYATLTDLGRATPGLAALIATQPTEVQFAVPGGSARQLEGETVFGDYFGTLGVRPQLGRFFQADELGVSSSAQVAVISDRLWRAEFDASTSVIGRSVRLNGADFTIIGVGPEKFLGVERVGRADVWLPPWSYRISRHEPKFTLDRRDLAIFMTVIGRLRPGVTAATVEAQMLTELTQLEHEYPESAERYRAFLPHVSPGLGTATYFRSYIEHTLRILAAIVIVVVLISCANAANLLLFRGVRRRGEMAVRRALGASPARLVRLHVTEGLLLGMCGGICGIIVAAGLRGVLRNQSIPRFPTMSEVSIDWRVPLFGFVLSLATGVLFALVPALIATRVDLVSRLKEAARSDAGGGTARLRRALVVLQIAASMTLVVTGVLFARTLNALHAVNLGLDIEHTTVFIADPMGQGYDRERVDVFRGQLIRELAARPGVDAVTFASNAPFANSSFLVDLRAAAPGQTKWPVNAYSYAVSPDYFATLGIPLLTGQTVPRGRPDTVGVTDVVISQATARRLFGMENPIGRVIEERKYRGPLTHRVVGVAGDVRALHLRGDPDFAIYSPLGASRLPGYGVFIVRSSLAPAEVQRVVRASVATVDGAVPVAWSYAMRDGVARAIATERLFTAAVTTLATLTVLLMAMGLYGVVAYSVAERTQEIGVRMALGATTRAVIRLVARQSLGLVAVGIALGTFASIGFSRLVAKWLFGVTPIDATSYAIGAVILIVLGAVAAVGPARSATAINPVDALRHE